MRGVPRTVGECKCQRDGTVGIHGACCKLLAQNDVGYGQRGVDAGRIHAAGGARDPATVVDIGADYVTGDRGADSARAGAQRQAASTEGDGAPANRAGDAAATLRRGGYRTEGHVGWQRFGEPQRRLRRIAGATGEHKRENGCATPADIGCAEIFLQNGAAYLQCRINRQCRQAACQPADVGAVVDISPRYGASYGHIHVARGRAGRQAGAAQTDVLRTTAGYRPAVALADGKARYNADIRRQRVGKTQTAVDCAGGGIGQCETQYGRAVHADRRC